MMINLYACRPIELVSTSRMESTWILCLFVTKPRIGIQNDDRTKKDTGRRFPSIPSY